MKAKKFSPVFHGEVVEGKMKLYDQERFLKYVRSFRRDDGEPVKITLTLKKFRKQRSNEQNAYYFGVVVEMLADELGYTPEEMHDALKWKFLRKKGVNIPTVRRTSDLSTVEFEDYLSNIRMWASLPPEQEGLGVYIPNPNEITFAPNEQNIGFQCRHLDGNKMNNNLDNLKWGSRSENQMDRVLHKNSNRGERHGMNKYSKDFVIMVRKMCETKMQKDVALELGIPRSTVSSFVSRSWKWLK